MTVDTDDYSAEDALLCLVEGCPRTTPWGIEIEGCGLSKIAPQTFEDMMTNGVYRTPIRDGRRLCHAEAIIDLWEAEGLFDDRPEETDAPDT